MNPQPPTAPTVVVALGSNLGESHDILHEAFAQLRSIADDNFKASSLWQSSPVDCPPGSPDFVNAAATFQARVGETAESLLGQLQQWEREAGRRPKRQLNEPRPLDLDLILFGQETRSTPTLVLPHPRAAQRRFVLEPLCELLPDLVPPGWNHSVRETLAALKSGEVLERIDPGGFEAR